MEKEKSGFFAKLKNGLNKTRINLLDGLDSVFHGFSEIDEDFYEELEEVLVMADIGVATTGEIIDEIKSKNDIVDVISSYINLNEKYKALCPFHDDHNPSLSVSSEKQIYKCFVCGESGNVFNFAVHCM